MVKWNRKISGSESKNYLPYQKSSSEHEAKVALLKARELMAEHKIVMKGGVN